MPERLRFMVLLGAWCAMRFGELAELRRSDLDLRRGVVRVRRAVVRVNGAAVVGAPKSDGESGTLQSRHTWCLPCVSTWR